MGRSLQYKNKVPVNGAQLGKGAADGVRCDEPYGLGAEGNGVSLQ